MIVKRVDLHFASGRDVLGSYWGFLSGGGLVIGQELGVEPGEPVVLDVRVGARELPQIEGRVLRVNGSTVIKLSSGASHARLLEAALTDSGDRELELALADAALGLAPI
jgi:hypothetical protein